MIIEYYITVKNSLDYNNIGKSKETLYSDFYEGTSKSFGILIPRQLKEKEILGFGNKILSENITDIWNKSLKPDTHDMTKNKPKNGDLDNTFVNQETLKNIVQHAK